jgi:hypothetical protein
MNYLVALGISSSRLKRFLTEKNAHSVVSRRSPAGSRTVAPSASSITKRVLRKLRRERLVGDPQPCLDAMLPLLPSFPCSYVFRAGCKSPPAVGAIFGSPEPASATALL